MVMVTAAHSAVHAPWGAVQFVSQRGTRCPQTCLAPRHMRAKRSQIQIRMLPCSQA